MTLRPIWIWSSVAVLIGASALAFWLSNREPPFDGINIASMDAVETWQPIVLMPWIHYGADFGGIPAWHTGGVSSDEQAEAWLGRLEQSGVKAVVWFLFADGRGGLTFDSKGFVTGLAPGFWRDYDALLALLKKHNLQVIWVLTDFELGMPPQTVKGVRLFGHADLIEDADKRASFMSSALTPLLRHGRNSSRIAAWILMNEPEHLLRSGYASEGAMSSFVNDAAGVIHKERRGQQVGLAAAGLPGLIEFSGEDGLDFLVFHYYTADLPPRAGFLRDYLQLVRPKPIYMGEFNLSHPPEGDLDTFVRDVHALGYSGAWPWSLVNRADESGNAAAETAPQFDAVAQYARSVAAPAADLRVTATREKSLAEIDARIVALNGQPEVHQSEAATNLEWIARCEKQIAAAGPGPHPDLERQLKTAAERAHMHEYLGREARTELRWLRALRAEAERER